MIEVIVIVVIYRLDSILAPKLQKKGEKTYFFAFFVDYE